MAALQKFWKAWQRFGKFIGDIVARVVLSIFYFTVLLPFGIGATFFGDTLGLKKQSESNWETRETPPATLESARRQF